MRKLKQSCERTFTALRYNPIYLRNLKRATIYCAALISSITESSNAIPGIEDSIFWLHGLLSQTDGNYTSAEDFFSDPVNRSWHNGLRWGNLIVFASVFITDLWFVGGLFTQKQLRAPNDASEPPTNVCCGLLSQTSAAIANPVYYSLYAVVLISALAEGFTSMPGLALMSHNLCDQSKGECDDSSEVFVRAYPLIIAMLLLACAIKAYVDFTVEGRHCLEQIDRCITGAIDPQDDAREQSENEDVLVEQTVDTEEVVRADTNNAFFNRTGMIRVKQCCERTLTTLRYNPVYLKNLKRATIYWFALISSITEGSSAIPGIEDSVFWLHGLLSQTDGNYISAEDFFSDPVNRSWRNSLRWGNVIVFASVFVTDLWFVGGLFTKKQLQALNDTSESQINVCRGRISQHSAFIANAVHYLLYAVVVISALAEGFTSMPGLAFMFHNLCDRSKGECDDSSEVFIRAYPLYITLVLLACAVKSYVDFTVEGRHCLDQINSCLTGVVEPQDDVYERLENAQPEVEQTVETEEVTITRVGNTF